MTLRIPAETIQSVRSLSRSHPLEDVAYACPRCFGFDGNLQFQATIWATIYTDGTDRDESDCEWDDTSAAQCECGWTGTVSETSEAAEQLVSVACSDE
jgi:hypothetical protein